MKAFINNQSAEKQNSTVFFRSQQHTTDRFFKPSNIQTKLTVNQPGDVYEQEADAVADKVMRMAEPGIQNQGFFSPGIQRKCSHCLEEEKKAHRKESSTADVAPAQTESYLTGLSGGRMLSESERSFFEPRFNADFSQVKIHTDTTAAQSAQSINSLAYTSGNHIVFNTGQYQPETQSGRRLMAHELTHVIQQNGRVQPQIIQRYGTEDTSLGSTSMAAIRVRECGTTKDTCYGRCRAADGSIGYCQWGGLTYGCRCRSSRGDEPPPVPVTRDVPWWVYALGGAAAALLIACFASGVCEAGAIIAAVGEAAAEGIMLMLRAAGILVTA